MLGIGNNKNPKAKLEPLEFYGKMLDVEIVEAKIRNGYASIRNGKVVIRVPKRCNMRSKERMIKELYGKISKSLKKKPESFISNLPLRFYDGEKIAPNGEKLTIEVRNGAMRGSARVGNGRVIARLGSDGKDVSDLVSKALARHFKGYVTEYVNMWNKRFGSELGGIKVSRGLTVWGSCSPKNNITINLRLLFMDKKFLDYVVVHELSHTKVRSHSKRFWTLIGKYIPEYRNIRRELKVAGANISTEVLEQKQGTENLYANKPERESESENLEKKSAPAGEGQRTLENFS